MSLIIRNLTIIIFFTFLCFSYISAQEKGINFIGIKPSVTVEPFYEKGELDINVFPLVYQRTISRRVDIKTLSIVNYGIRNNNSSFSHLGFQFAVPIFFKLKEKKSEPSKGFYIAPGFGLSRNLIEKHNNLGFWVEPGYNLLITQKLSISFSIQLGATQFWYDDGTQKLGNHFGIQVIFGKWFL